MSLADVLTHGPLGFLPLDLGSNTTFKLAVVDASRLPALLAFPWHAGGRGTVWRQHGDATASRAEGRRIVRREHLAEAVLGVRGQPVAYKNGDPLDCRVANLRPGETTPASRFKPASVVPFLDGYGEALAALTPERTHELFRATRRRAQPARVSEAQTRAFLEELLTMPVLYEASVRDLAQRFSGQVGHHYTVSQMHKILQGRSLHVPGFDYARLQALRPTIRERALRREEGFRMFGEFGRKPRPSSDI